MEQERPQYEFEYFSNIFKYSFSSESITSFAKCSASVIEFVSISNPTAAVNRFTGIFSDRTASSNAVSR